MFLQKLQKVLSKPQPLQRKAQLLQMQHMNMMQVVRMTGTTRHHVGSARPVQFYTMPTRAFSKKDDDYSSQFESLLGKAAKPITEEEKAEIERKKIEKAARDAATSSKEEMVREKQAEQKAQDFDDLLSGKKQADSEKNLQTLFSEFYQKTKQIEVKDYVNSAKGSLGSLSGSLEKRREKMRQMKEDALNLDKATGKTEAADQTKTKDGDKQGKETKVDATKDQASASATESTPDASESAEETKDKATDKATAEEEMPKEETIEEPVVPKMSMKEKLSNGLNGRLSAMDEKFSTKFPKVHEKSSHYFGTLKDVWAETFPNEQKKASSKRESRRERARLAREMQEKMEEMTQEEIEALQAEVPERLQGQLILQSDDEEEKVKPGYYGKLKEKISSTEAAQNFYKSDEFKKIEDLRKEAAEFKADLRDQADASHSPVVQMANQGIDKVTTESKCAKAVKAMQRYDPEFDLEDLTEEASQIFQEFYCNYLSDNKEFIDIVCGGTAGAQLKALVDLREKEGWKYRFQELLNCSHCILQGGFIENRVPQFIYHIEVQEFDERVNVETGEVYEDENVKAKGIMNNTYRIVLSRHEEPDMEVTGHYWEIIEFYKIGESTMIA